MSRCGIGRSVNVNQVCKGFNDVIEASNDFINNCLTLKERSITSFLHPFSLFTEHINKSNNNSKTKLNSTTNTNNTSLPVLTPKDNNDSSKRKLINYKKDAIKYIYPNITPFQQFKNDNSLFIKNKFSNPFVDELFC